MLDLTSLAVVGGGFAPLAGRAARCDRLRGDRR